MTLPARHLVIEHLHLLADSVSRYRRPGLLRVLHCLTHPSRPSAFRQDKSRDKGNIPLLPRFVFDHTFRRPHPLARPDRRIHRLRVVLVGQLQVESTFCAHRDLVLNA